MPKYYCDYCDTYLTHDSPSVRKTHCQGRKHKENVKFYYQKWMEEQAQSLIDRTTAAFKAGKLQTNPFPNAGGAAIPPPPSLQGGPQTQIAIMGGPGPRQMGPRPGLIPTPMGPMGPMMVGPGPGQPMGMPGMRPGMPGPMIMGGPPMGVMMNPVQQMAAAQVMTQMRN